MNATETVNHWGARLVDFALPMLIQSSLLIVVLFALDVLLRQRVRAVVRYALWMLLLVKLVLPPSLALPTSLGYWLGAAKWNPTPTTQRARVAVRDNQTPRDLLNSYELFTRAKPPQEFKPDGWLLLAWLTGTLSLLGYVAYRNSVGIERKVSSARDASPELKRLLAECCEQMGGRKAIRIVTSGEATSPAVCGLWRPMILLPGQLADRLSALVLVELAGEAEAYASTLVEVAKLALPRPTMALGLIAIVESKSALMQRIHHLLNRPVPGSARLSLAGLAVLLMTGAVLVPMARGQRRPEKAGDKDRDGIVIKQANDSTAKSDYANQVVMIEATVIGLPAAPGAENQKFEAKGNLVPNQEKVSPFLDKAINR